MTVILMLVMFGVFIAVDVLTSKRPMVVKEDVRYFDHSLDQFASLGFTMADGGQPVSLTTFKEMFEGATITEITFDGQAYRAELNNGKHIAFGA